MSCSILPTICKRHSGYFVYNMYKYIIVLWRTHGNMSPCTHYACRQPLNVLAEKYCQTFKHSHSNSQKGQQVSPTTPYEFQFHIITHTVEPVSNDQFRYTLTDWYDQMFAKLLIITCNTLSLSWFCTSLFNVMFERRMHFRRDYISLVH